MAIELNHTIAWVHDKHASARFVAEVLGLPAPKTFSHFLVIELANGVSLDFGETADEIAVQHYAFLVSEREFDEIFGRIRARGIEYWADPGRKQAMQINRNDGGRGVYFEEPGGHFLEIITRPYGSGT